MRLQLLAQNADLQDVVDARLLRRRNDQVSRAESLYIQKLGVWILGGRLTAQAIAGGNDLSE